MSGISSPEGLLKGSLSRVHVITNNTCIISESIWPSARFHQYSGIFTPTIYTLSWNNDPVLFIRDRAETYRLGKHAY